MSLGTISEEKNLNWPACPAGPLQRGKNLNFLFEELEVDS